MKKAGITYLVTNVDNIDSLEISPISKQGIFLPLFSSFLPYSIVSDSHTIHFLNEMFHSMIIVDAILYPFCFLFSSACASTGNSLHLLHLSPVWLLLQLVWSKQQIFLCIRFVWRDVDTRLPTILPRINEQDSSWNTCEANRISQYDTYVLSPHSCLYSAFLPLILFLNSFDLTFCSVAILYLLVDPGSFHQRSHFPSVLPVHARRY